MSSFSHFLFYLVIISGVTRGFSLGGNLAKRGPLASTQKKIIEMMVNLDVDDYSKTLNHRKIIRKLQKKNPLTTKTILKPKYKLRWSSVFTFSLSRGGNSTHCPLSVTSPAMIFCIYIQNCLKKTDRAHQEFLHDVEIWINLIQADDAYGGIVK